MILENWLAHSSRGRIRLVIRKNDRSQTSGSRRCAKTQSRAFAAEILEERTLLAASALGAELVANATTSGTQRTGSGGGRSVAVAPDNSYVAVWTSSTGDGSGYGIYARRFAVDGTPLSEEMLVNTTTSNDQTEPAVAVASDGRFVVVWQSQGQDGSGLGIYAREFNASGAALTGEIAVSQTTAGNQQTPAVAFLTGGGFAVTWAGAGTGDTSGVFARIFDSAGTPTTNEFRINQTTTGTQSQPAITSDGAGGFAVTWSGNGVGDGSGIFFRRFNAAGTAVTNELLVNQTTSGTQQTPSIDVRGDGTFVVAWSGNGAGDSSGVFARRLTAMGTTIGGEILVNQTTSGTQQTPSITSTGTTFSVAWNGNGTGDPNGVFFRQFNANGTAAGSETRVNTTTSGNQTQPTIAALNGGLVVAWSGNGAGDSAGVFVERYTNFHFTVNSFADTIDANPGNGSATDSTGRTTLRAAIMEANALNEPVPVLITLQPGTYALTRVGSNEDADSTGDLDVTSKIEIDGVGATGSSTTTIDAHSIDRVFQALAGSSLTLWKVKVTGGNAANTVLPGGGAIAGQQADVIVADSLITGNTTTNATQDFAGGGIAVDGGKVFIRNTTVSGNSATGGSSGEDGYGAGVTAADGAYMNITNSHIDGNSADEGGGIFLYTGAVGEIHGGTVSGNTAGGGGGRISVELASLTLDGTTLANNTSTTSEGGGLWNFGGNVAVTNSSFTNNTAGRSGGAIENTGRITAAIGTMSIAGSTITGNSAPDGGGIFNSRDSVLAIDSTNISNNKATTGNGGGLSNSNTESFGPGSVTVTNSTLSGNQAAVYGGGIFAIKNHTDLTNTTVSNNSAYEGGGTANIDSGVMTVTDSLVTGNVSGHEGGGLTNEEAPLTIIDTTVSNNSVTGHGGGLYTFAGTVSISGSTFTANTATGDGGGVENTGRVTAAIGTMTIDDSTFSGNSATNGGGIDNKRDSVMTVTGSTVTGNSATNGGGVANFNTESFAPGTLSIDGTTIANNTATGDGGGVYTLKNSTNITNSTLSGNSAHEGGGISNRTTAALNVTNTTISGNQAHEGGGVYVMDVSTATLINDTIAANSADVAGGAVADDGTTVSVGNTIIAKNSATTRDPDTEGEFNSLGHNLVGIVGDATGFSATDRIGTSTNPIDPLLGMLQNNGGPTATMALLAGSPAIDGGDNTLATNAGLTSDQRGQPRVQDGDNNGSATVDIGAYEYQFGSDTDAVFSDSGTLNGVLNG